MISLRDTTDRAAALALLAEAAEHATDGASIADIAVGCCLIDVCEHGQRVGALAVEIRPPFATIKAATSHGQRTAEELTLLEHVLAGMGVRHVAFFTKRPGLIRSMQRAGYRVRDCEMEKVLHG